MTLTPQQKRLIRRYRGCFTNTGGNQIEELLETKVDVRINWPVAMLQSMVLAQLQMLERLVEAGALPLQG